MILLKLLNLIKNSECVLGPTIVESEFFVLQSYFQTKLLKKFFRSYTLCYALILFLLNISTKTPKHYVERLVAAP